MSFPFGQTVTVASRVRSGTDAYGNDVFTTSTVDVENVPVWPRNSSELVQGEDLTIVGVSMLLPAGTNVSAIDKVIVGGVSYEVDGEPGVYDSPLTGFTAGVQVNLTRVTG